MLPRQFASQKALLDYAEQKGLVYMWAYTQRERVLSPAFIAREHLLSPDQYELVDVRTRSGVRRALLFPKATVYAERQEGWDVPKRVHEPEGATGPR